MPLTSGSNKQKLAEKSCKLEYADHTLVVDVGCGRWDLNQFNFLELPHEVDLIILAPPKPIESNAYYIKE